MGRLPVRVNRRRERPDVQLIDPQDQMQEPHGARAEASQEEIILRPNQTVFHLLDAFSTPAQDTRPHGGMSLPRLVGWPWGHLELKLRQPNPDP